MTSSLAVTLAVAATSLGALHTLSPDHWLPIAAVARARSWSLARTGRIALLCGSGHVTVSAALGVTALVAGRHAVESFGTRMGAVASLLLIGFGTAYALWGARHVIGQKLHGHDHARFDHVHRPASTTVWAMFAIYCADPCVAVVPIIFAASPLSWLTVLAIVALYEISTIGTMVTLVMLSRASASALLRGQWMERYGDAAAGGLIAVTGVAVGFLGA